MHYIDQLLATKIHQLLAQNITISHQYCDPGLDPQAQCCPCSNWALWQVKDTRHGLSTSSHSWRCCLLSSWHRGSSMPISMSMWWQGHRIQALCSQCKWEQLLKTQTLNWRCTETQPWHTDLKSHTRNWAQKKQLMTETHLEWKKKKFWSWEGKKASKPLLPSRKFRVGVFDAVGFFVAAVFWLI